MRIAGTVVRKLVNPDARSNREPNQLCFVDQVSLPDISGNLGNQENQNLFTRLRQCLNRPQMSKAAAAFDRDRQRRSFSV